MEQRHGQIKEGAGLEESRLNTEFIEMLTKWGPHVMMGMAILVGLYAGYNWWTRQQEKKADDAFVELAAASNTANPTTLERIALEYSSATAVPVDARSEAAMIHLRAARTGVPVGERVDRDGKLPEGKAFLTAEERNAARAKAEELFKGVVEKANSSLGQTQYAIGALSGLASIAEDRGELDKARDYYQQAIAKATDKKLDQLVDLLKKRVETLESLRTPARLYTAAELPGAPTKEVTVPLGNFTGKTSTGETIQLGPGTPDGAPTPIQIPGGGSLVPTSPPSATPPPGGTPPEDKPAEKPAETPEAPKPATP